MDRIDTRQSVETPEGVSFYIHPAGPVPRIQAAIIDVLIRIVLLVGLAIIFSSLGAVGVGLMLIGLFVVNWGYPIYFEMYHRGRTPGKMVFDLQVRSADGTPVSWRGSALRNLLRVADFLPFGYVGGICVMTGSRRFQRLGDLAADTVVCYRQVRGMPDAEALPNATPHRPPQSLTLEEQRAIVEFALRSQHWNRDRNRELATTARPLTGPGDADDGVEYLRGVAHGIVHGSS